MAGLLSCGVKQYLTHSPKDVMNVWRSSMQYGTYVIHSRTSSWNSEHSGVGSTEVEFGQCWTRVKSYHLCRATRQNDVGPTTDSDVYEPYCCRHKKKNLYLYLNYSTSKDYCFCYNCKDPMSSNHTAIAINKTSIKLLYIQRLQFL